MARKNKTEKKINIINDLPEIVLGISKAHGLDKKVAAGVVEDVLNSIKDTLTTNMVVGLKNFGHFRIQRREGMKYYDFATQSIQTRDRNIVVFYPAANFKTIANQVTVATATPAKTEEEAHE